MINFTKERNGYSKEQVDAYIKTLNDEYVKVTEEYQKLLEETEEQKKDTSYTEAIAAALINAEISGKQIIADAQLEAKQIIYEANQEKNRIGHTKQTVLGEIKSLSTKLGMILSEEEPSISGKEIER